MGLRSKLKKAAGLGNPFKGGGIGGRLGGLASRLGIGGVPGVGGLKAVTQDAKFGGIPQLGRAAVKQVKQDAKFASSTLSDLNSLRKRELGLAIDTTSKVMENDLQNLQKVAENDLQNLQKVAETDRENLSKLNEVRKDELDLAKDINSSLHEMNKDLLRDLGEGLGIIPEAPPQVPPAAAEALAHNVAAGLNNQPNVRQRGFADIAQMEVEGGKRKRGRQLSSTLGINA